MIKGISYKKQTINDSSLRGATFATLSAGSGDEAIIKKFLFFFKIASQKALAMTAVIFIFLTMDCFASDDWQIAKSTHFIVYYNKVSEHFVDQLIDKAEKYYDDIADDLGFRRYNFWLWDNRAKIYVYDDTQKYQAATNQPSWSGGCAIVREKVIHTFPNARGFLENILPHEMGHIIFREFIGFDNPASPIWLDEGVASYQEKTKYSYANRIVKEAESKKTFMSLADLATFRPGPITDNNTVGIFYSEAFSIVDFLIKKFGQDNFIYFCQNLRDKKDLNRAISSVYRFADIEELEEAWRKYVK